jgi:FkbM family methyltransferase
MIRAAAFLVQRYVLGRQTLLVRVPDFDLELRVQARDKAGQHLYRRGMHAPVLTHFLATGLDLKPDDVVFDIGASIGWHSLVLARIAPRGVQIHAFEPDPWARGLLQENVSRNGADAITIAGMAVGETAGVASLRRQNHRRRRRNAVLPLPGTEVLEVEMVSLDEYCRRNALVGRAVGFIKIGIEGLEYSALRGAVETLARCRAVLTEFSPPRLAQAGVHPAALLDLLVELGFTPAVLESGVLQQVDRNVLLEDGRQREIFWSARHAARPGTAAIDPDALAI